ncbi:hypothetical protein [Paenisporosarcina cavernae]|uniref:Helix-turn-helix domain-containing protein n=1 Tax=Paenisporosarcina cavernae TaxID=2320858 RepID=A0A385YQF4_9BACL|nr:hypothetical protein [Paenisporosarcina cavernae]AYC28691.1 hypothetical protein D3873_01945 [Paenisporosarcina cavernae]
MRKVRGVKQLISYLESIHCPMSEATLYRLVKIKAIPFSRPSPGILIFDLDCIDKWLDTDVIAQ